jgi:peptide/nickel transport system permease protein
LIVSGALSVPGFIMSETTLSYLGLGIVDPAVSWGSLIRRDLSTLNNLRSFPWLLAPVWLLVAVTLAFNFLGDVLRDFYDPYHRVFFRFRLPGAIGRFGGKKNAAGQAVRDSEASTAPQTDTAARPSAAPLLEVEGLTVSFLQSSSSAGERPRSVHAVRGVSFSIARGEILGIVGESGSGKTVTTTAIPRLLPVNAETGGAVRFGGRNLLALHSREVRAWRGKKIGMIFQEPGRSFDPLQNLGSVFLEAFRNADPRVTRSESDSRAATLLEEVGLANTGDRLANFPHQFSGGQLQRIGIALALAQGCELLIADEPTTALDVTIQAQIVALLRKIRDARGVSIIFISHDISLVAGIADRIAVMYGGRIMESGTAAEVMTSPRHPYTRALLAAAPRFGTHWSSARLQPIPGKAFVPSMEDEGCPFADRCPKVRGDCRTARFDDRDSPRVVRCVLEAGGQS